VALLSSPGAPATSVSPETATLASASSPSALPALRYASDTARVTVSV
jgi:hypothetical protein